MLSSLSTLNSFLPSALQINNDDPGTTRKGRPPPLAVDKIENDEEEEVEPEDQKAKKKKEKGATETFIFVRPPPAKSNHPLNLQVQLVPPNTRAPGLPQTATTMTPRQSLDVDPGAQQTPLQADYDEGFSGHELSRTASEVSTFSTSTGAGHSQTPSSSSYAGSTASFSSVGSTSSSAGSRRAIIPLYNLQAHNVMTNTIVDAGTDAKIARFTKKGLEMVELGVLECVEVWALKDKDGIAIVPPPQTLSVPGQTRSSLESQPGSKIIRKQSSSVSAQGGGGSGFVDPSKSKKADTPETTPGSSVVSVVSSAPGSAETPDSSVVSPPKKNIFGKLFSSKSPILVSPTNSKHSRTQSSSSTAANVTPTPKSADQLLSAPISGDGGRSSPTPSRHSKHLSATFANWKRDRSASPNPASPRTSFNPPPSPKPSYEGLPASESPPRGSVEVGAAPNTTSSGFAAQNSNKDGAPVVVLPATLGIQPTLNSLLPFPFPAAILTGEKSAAEIQAGLSYKLPRGPAMYVWIVKRWLKPSFVEPSSVLGIQVNSKLFGGGGRDANGSGSGMGQVEVRVEWKKAKNKSKKKAGNRRREREDDVSRKSSRRSSYIGDEKQQRRQPSKSRSRASLVEGAGDDSNNKKGGSRLSKRLSLLSSTLTDEPAGEDSGEESDPEDSETPWNCVIKVKKPSAKDGGIRLKVGSLSPAPHHPKVVGMLKVPYPLPDVEFQEGGDGAVVLRKKGEEKGQNALTLTAEELKDVLCSTGMWLVVKEGFGGVGRVGRKGDGWRIRA